MIDQEGQVQSATEIEFLQIFSWVKKVNLEAQICGKSVVERNPVNPGGGQEVAAIPWIRPTIQNRL